jgi:hypothetical protein
MIAHMMPAKVTAVGPFGHAERIQNVLAIITVTVDTSAPTTASVISRYGRKAGAGSLSGG